MQVENIKKFLQTAYSDEKLAVLLAHAQDGKLKFLSCCCFVGLVTADHALCDETYIWSASSHYAKAITLTGALLAMHEFGQLAHPHSLLGPEQWDEDRRTHLIPLILDEMERRAAIHLGIETEKELTYEIK